MHILDLLLLSQLFKQLLGRPKSQGRCWVAIRLFHRPEPSGHAVHGEVDGLDIGGQHGRRLVLLRHTHRLQRRPYPICTNTIRNVRHRRGGGWAEPRVFLEGSFWGVGAGVGDKNAESYGVVRPLRIPLVIRPMRRAYVVVVRWTDEMLCGGYKWVSRFEAPCVCTRWTGDILDLRASSRYTEQSHNNESELLNCVSNKFEIWPCVLKNLVYVELQSLSRQRIQDVSSKILGVHKLKIGHRHNLFLLSLNNLYVVIVLSRAIFSERQSHILSSNFKKLAIGYEDSQMRWSRNKLKNCYTDIYVNKKTELHMQWRIASSAVFIPSIQLTFTQLYLQQQPILPIPNCFKIADDIDVFPK